jgi:transcriptional regulator with XRE-family HTH domain
MKLKDYISAYEKNLYQFAKRIGVPQATIWRIVNNKFMPRADTIKIIIKGTGGKVTPEDLLDIK